MTLQDCSQDHVPFSSATSIGLTSVCILLRNKRALRFDQFPEGDEVEEEKQKFTEYHLSQRHSLNPQQSRCWFAILHFPLKLKEDKYLLQGQVTPLQIPKPWFYHIVLPQESPNQKASCLHLHSLSHLTTLTFTALASWRNNSASSRHPSWML